MRYALIDFLEGKKLNDRVITSSLSLDPIFDDTTVGMHSFLVTVEAITKGECFSVELFKTTFRLSNKAAIHEKLIEVFSYRNDVSQRRAIIEEMFHLLFSKHRFEIPKHLVLRRQEEILKSLRDSPDYQAYKSHQNFMMQVSQLAEKQLKEEILIDQIAANERIKIETKDIQQYLNLLSNKRLKEFLYFRSFFDIAEQYSRPIHQSVLKQIFRREKTLNHILHHLTS